MSAIVTDEAGFSDDPRFCDWCLGQSVQALIEDGEEETAALLVACSLDWYTSDNFNGRRELSATLSGPISVIKGLRGKVFSDDFGEFEQTQHYVDPRFRKFQETLDLVLGPYTFVTQWGFKVSVNNLPSNWHEELLEIARKKGTTNQGPRPSDAGGRVIEYNNLRFRSQSEVKIAQALDKSKVMYFANCTARVNRGGDRVNREPDFLVCDSGRWGILEVDGEPFHPPTRTVHDHDRDRIFEKHGVRFVQHYDAQRCYQEPDQVVAEFLDLLAQNG